MKLPADLGITGLGLVMALGGAVFAAATLLLGVPMIVDYMERGGAYGAKLPVVELVGMMAVVALGEIRAANHALAGAEMLYGAPDKALRALHRYAWWSLAHAVVTALVVWRHGVAIPVAIAVAGALWLWPQLVLTLATGRLRQLAADHRYAPPVPEDRGFESLAVLMTALGAAGFTTALALAGGLLGDDTDALRRQGAAVLLFALVGVMLVRSVLHVIAGRAALHESPERALAAVQRYAQFGVISSVIAGGVLMVMLVGYSGLFVAIIGAPCVAGALLAWPMAVRRFATTRHMDEIAAGPQVEPNRRPPDLGMTAIGWLLLGLGTIGLGAGAIAQIAGAGVRMPIVGLLRLPIWDDGKPWLTLIAAGLQLWIALELITMSARRRLVGIGAGLAAAALGLYLARPLLDVDAVAFDPYAVLRIALLICAVVLPAMTAALLLRPSGPGARARYRARD